MSIELTAHHVAPHKDARKLVRFLQCSQCSYPFRTPVTLPCGNSLCRQCLPPQHIREHISYPATPSRETGITCPFPECGQEHTLDDCSLDVILLNLIDTIATEIRKMRTEAGHDNQLHLEEVPQFGEPEASSEESTNTDTASLEKVHSRTLHGGRIVSTFTFAEMGELHYTSDIEYEAAGAHGDEPSIDRQVFDTLSEGCRDRVECHVCYSMLLDPTTTPCGHSFCRKCLIRSLDHSTLCPHCRRELHLSPTLGLQKDNKTLVGLLNLMWAEELKARRETFEIDERSAPGGLNTSLFICAVAFPLMPIVLHVFEPRYRLMVRRALESNRQFGMITYNQYHRTQGALGRTQFLEMGTMLHIEQCQVLPDGRSWLLCRGLYRFKVLEHGALDGYIIGRVQRHDDTSLAEEERIEAEESSAPVNPNDPMSALDHMSTNELFAQGKDFMQRAQAQSARWLEGSIQEVYGEPPEDPAIFPYWFASVVPLPDEEKYTLLPTDSVRQRLKIMVKWIKQVESQRWYVPPFLVAYTLPALLHHVLYLNPHFVPASYSLHSTPHPSPSKVGQSVD